MAKTEYRIIPCKTFIGDMYLQFKTTDKKNKLFGGIKEEDNWRFIPKELDAYVLGYYLNQDSCPTSLPFMQEGRFIHSFYEQESYELIPFTKRYEDVEQYFEHLRKKREEYLIGKKLKAENAKTIYL